MRIVPDRENPKRRRRVCVRKNFRKILLPIATAFSCGRESNSSLRRADRFHRSRRANSKILRRQKNLRAARGTFLFRAANFRRWREFFEKRPLSLFRAEFPDIRRL